MVIEYHQLVADEELALDDPAALAIPRAQRLRDAVDRNGDYKLLQLLRTAGKTEEILIVEVKCDEVPSKNRAGILFRERLAIRVSANENVLPDVRCLRKNFPILIHQNQTAIGQPISLCLYFESPIAVRRTWTPQNFLRRIQWWLEKTARNELHPATLPVEGLFFTSKTELVLPWNFDELHRTAGVKFVGFIELERPDGSFTVRLQVLLPGAVGKVGSFAPIEITSQPIVHGKVEGDPRNLGELVDIIASRGGDILPDLREIIRSKVPAAGAAIGGDEKFTIILLHVPIVREAGGEIEAVSRRAFLIAKGPFAIGAAIDALVELNEHYFTSAGVLENRENVDWRDIVLLPMAVLRENSAQAARRQSGLTSPGLASVLIGAGSLGSAMLNIWTRSGWGQWTVIDSDHVKPHNLSRHVAYGPHIGFPKASVVADLAAEATNKATSVAPIVANALSFAMAPVKSALENASLVIDASTTLEYPRAISQQDIPSRHASVFVTPSGDGCVLLAEDKPRSIRLRTLEAQYYRSLINEEWGNGHIATTNSFWSGASCRDISAVLPYSKILAHAATLAEQVQIFSEDEDALIRVWSRNAKTGETTLHEVNPFTEQNLKMDDVDVYIDAGLVGQLREWRQQNLPNETGGVLLGYYDFNIKSAVIVSALPAPPDSKSGPHAFERGVLGLREAIDAAIKRTAGVVGYLGEWHSHPKGHSADPSHDDIIQLVHLALGMADDGLPAFQLIVGEDDLQINSGHVR